MLQLIDGNNVMIRAATQQPLNKIQPISLRMRYELACVQPQVWFWDGPNHNDRRIALYPGYKRDRPPLAENIYSQIKLFKTLLTHSRATQITVDKWEADDCINTFARRLNTPVTIQTNDQDYYQLADLPHVTLDGVTKLDCHPKWTPLYKACRGDTSDRIDGIPGFGIKTWEKLAGREAEFQNCIIKGQLLGCGWPLPRGVMNWLDDADNIKTLQNMLAITHMWTVPEDELNAGIQQPTYNPDAAGALLARYFL